MKQHAVVVTVLAFLLLGTRFAARASEWPWDAVAALSPGVSVLASTSNPPLATAAPAPSPAIGNTTGLGDMSGTFDVHGTEAVGKEAYRGVVTVTRSGDVYAVNYKDDESTVEGVGLVDGLIFSVAYISEGVPAILILKKTADGHMEGPWAYRGENSVSKEIWKRR
ncbi:MAG: hypothetical protein HQL07_19225 [Nitrospirae bacterium]|nr:hypothetical protein [Magnetococcales bacterium]